ncbi:hypothetical protein CRUP_002835 [Coryphaenoides rupestris]|nr:hypothetical protein CRUP_002835 [Coryphaenoides rupestris]
MPMNMQLTSESTVNVLKMIRSATPFPLVSLLFMFIGFVLNNIGLALVVGLVLYISTINDEMFSRTRSSEAFFSYQYGWSFAFAAISFLLTESAGVMSVYLFMKRYTAEEMYQPRHPSFLPPRLSNCSDPLGQFPAPGGVVARPQPLGPVQRGLAAMSASYPALLKCPSTTGCPPRRANVKFS